jgi:CBS domain-containing protein
MKIFELMERPIRRIDEDSTVQKAAEIMGKKHVGSLVVTDEKEDVGIITERDIMTRIIAENRDLNLFKVKDVMSKPLVTVDKDVDPEAVIRLMADKRVRRVLVTDVDGIVGVFSTSDVTKLVAMNP